MKKPIGKYKCVACNRTWDGSQLYQNSQSTAAKWTCGNIFCGGSVVKISLKGATEALKGFNAEAEKFYNSLRWWEKIMWHVKDVYEEGKTN